MCPFVTVIEDALGPPFPTCVLTESEGSIGGCRRGFETGFDGTEDVALGTNFFGKKVGACRWGIERGGNAILPGGGIIEKDQHP